MRRMALLGIILSVVAGQASADPRPALRSCFTDAIARLDDGVSDASTIGRVVALECGTEIEAAARALRREIKTTEGVDVPADVMEDGFIQLATTAVLFARVKKAVRP